MSLDHAILAFVNEQARSGYDLKKAFDDSIAHVWPANQSQIYQTLARLLKQGMVKMSVVQQEGKPNRKVYSITPSGQAELRRWLAAPLPINNLREAFVIQFFFADAITLEELVELLEERARAHHARLEFFRQARKGQDETPPKGRWDKVLHPLTVELGIALDETWLAWAERAKSQVKALPKRNR
jgi:DNA-binding PadR family transcriptional regulator